MSQDLPTSLKLRVISPSDLLLDEEVQEVFLPSLDGYIGIYPGHRPLFVALGQGQLTYKRTNIEKTISVREGYAEVLHDRVLVFVKQGKNETDLSPEAKG
jgi:F-type H+-transporting ATPase subunit epsilon